MTYAAWRERLGEANDPELYPLAYQDQILADGQAQFWATEDGAIITQVTQYPSGLLGCTAFAGAGDMPALLTELKPQIEAWAKARGCSRCFIEGRDGWRRVHPDYRHHKTVIMKAI